MTVEEFVGCKIAIICDDEVIVYLRDDKPNTVFPNRWDLPGGRRQGDETPEECALREVKDGFGIDIPLRRIIWKKRYPGLQDSSKSVYFLIAGILPDEISAIKFGEEGQRWKMIKIKEFLSSNDYLSAYHERFLEFLSTHKIEDN